MIQEWLNEYRPVNNQEIFDAMREIMQEITLAGLSRSGFFEKAAFYGGTALRIFYGLDRYSEDLDFLLLGEDATFSLEPYFDAIVMEFAALGMTVSINEKRKTITSNIESAFLKSETIWKELVLEGIVPQAGVQVSAQMKIKIEVDKQPPLGFHTEEKLLIRPFSFYVKTFTLESLFSGKMHALLFRKWKSRVKGRDWFDLEWYIKKGAALDLEHFKLRAKDTGDWTQDVITPQDVIALLTNKIDEVSMEQVKEDVLRFIPDDSVLNLWSQRYFLDLIQQIKFK